MRWNSGIKEKDYLQFVSSRVSEGSSSMDVGRSMETPDIGPSITRSSTGMGLPLPFLKRFRECL
jgi:hypothetical protein